MRKLMLIFSVIVLFSQFAIAQQRQISGVVTSSDERLPIIGAAVIDKSTGSGVSTDIDGRFNITVSANTTVLVFSSLGYMDQEVPITGSVVNVTLVPDITSLGEVMVVAYGTGKRSSFTGSATVVNKEQIERVKSSNISQSLQGMSSGVQVINNSGAPGASASIVIRGIGSMNTSISPLYVVDGTPYSGYVNAISPADIESISILKDASASALYGSRAANGVIMITTKKGSREDGQINFRSSTSFSSLAVPMPRQLTPQEYSEVVWQSIYFGYMDEGIAASQAANLATQNLATELKVNPFNTATPVGTDGKMSPSAQLLYWGDWRSELLKSRPRQEYTLDFSKKTQDANQFFSVSYLDDKGIFTTQQFHRITARANVNTKIKKWLEVGTNTSFAHSLTDSPTGSSTIWFLRTMPTIYPVYEYDYSTGAYKNDGQGNLVYDYGDNRMGWVGWNPLADAAYNKYKSQVENMSSRNFAEITFLPELKFRSTYSFDYYIYSYHGYTTPDYGYMIGRGGISKQRDRSTSSTTSNILTYNKTFGDHTISVLAGQEFYITKRNYLSASREDLPFGGLYELSSAATMTDSSSGEDNYRLLSYFSRLEYDYKDKYYLSASLRSDGSSRFSPKSRWGTFWSAGASWRVSEEDFMAPVSWVDNLKYKISYGAVGNDGLGSYYAYQGLYATGYDDYGQPGLMISRLPNEDLRWETNLQFNTGIEFMLFKKLSGSIEYFVRKSKDLLFFLPMASSTGFSGIDRNIGDIKNFGFELDLNYTPFNKQDFWWNINLNATHYQNVVTRLPQNEINSGVFKWREGESIYNFWGAEYAGLNPENGNDQWWRNIYETVNGEKILKERVLTENSSDVSGDDQKKYLGNALPDLFGGITNSFRFKGIDFSFMFYYSLGGRMYDSDYSQMMGYRQGFSYHPDILNAWTPENSSSTVTRFSKAFSNSQQSYSSKYIFDNTFLRLRNVSLGYTLPKSLLNKIGVNTLRIYVQGDNLMTWGSAARRGTDPEQSINGTTSNRFPTYKSFSFGIQLGL